MADFRKISPVRRTDVPEYDSHTKYKALLRADFHQRCGYCGDHDFFRDTYYEVDHFVPKKHLVKISDTAYSNLVYSCRSCNNSKRAKWPTKDETVHNDGKMGFVDPCDSSYADHFERIADGSIRSMTELGSWMWSALNFGNPVHRVRFKLEELKLLLDELDNSDTYSLEELMAIKRLNTMYRNLEEQLKGTPIFT